MAQRGAVKVALRGFLGTFKSRYSDDDGYWLFGLLIESLRRHQIDLLADATSDAVVLAMGALNRLAIDRFRDQIGKQELPIESIQSAQLSIERRPALRSETHGSPPVTRAGYDLDFKVVVVMKDGGTHHASDLCFVAPHDPNLELRRVLSRIDYPRT